MGTSMFHSSESNCSARLMKTIHFTTCTGHNAFRNQFITKSNSLRTVRFKSGFRDCRYEASLSAGCTDTAFNTDNLSETRISPHRYSLSSLCLWRYWPSQLQKLGNRRIRLGHKNQFIKLQVLRTKRVRSRKWLHPKIVFYLRHSNCREQLVKFCEEIGISELVVCGKGLGRQVGRTVQAPGMSWTEWGC